MQQKYRLFILNDVTAYLWTFLVISSISIYAKYLRSLSYSILIHRPASLAAPHSKKGAREALPGHWQGGRGYLVAEKSPPPPPPRAERNTFNPVAPRQNTGVRRRQQQTLSRCSTTNVKQNKCDIC